MSSPNVVIAGAGIGGLTLAVALRRTTHILERAAKLEPEGAGLMLQINAMRALRQLGLDEAVIAAGVPVRAGFGFDERGKKLSELDLGSLSDELGAPVIGIHRGRLQAILLEALGDSVRTSARVDTYEESDGGIDAILDGGERVHGDMLIGADGLRSRVRAKMLGDVPARYAGYTSWRGVAKVTGLLPKNAICETWGRGLRFGAVEIAKDETYWFAVANAPAGEREDDAHAAVTSRFAHFPAPIPELVAATEPARVFRTDVHDRDPIDSFCNGRVALLGDAAHPMTPDLGQGACLAIEDAVALAKCLAESEPAAALRAYDEKRVPRAREVVLASRSFGRLGRIDNAVGVFFRNLALKSTPKGVVAKQSRKVVDYSV